MVTAVNSGLMDQLFVGGMTVRQFLKKGSDAGYIYLAIVTVAITRGTMVGKDSSWESSDPSDFRRFMRLFFQTLYKNNGFRLDPKQLNIVDPAGFSFIAEAFVELWHEYFPCDRFDLNIFQNQTGWSEQYAVDALDDYERWLKGILLSQAPECIVILCSGRRYAHTAISVADIPGMFPYGSMNRDLRGCGQVFLAIPRTFVAKQKRITIFNLAMNLTREDLISSGSSLYPVTEGEMTFNPKEGRVVIKRSISYGGDQIFAWEETAQDSPEAGRVLADWLAEALQNSTDTRPGRVKGLKLDDISSTFALQKDAMDWNRLFILTAEILNLECKFAGWSHPEIGRCSLETLKARLREAVGSVAVLSRVPAEKLKIRWYDEKVLALLHAWNPKPDLVDVRPYVSDPKGFEQVVFSVKADLQAGSILRNLKVNEGGLKRLAFRPDGTVVTTQGMDLPGFAGHPPSSRYYPVLWAEDLVIVIDKSGSTNTVAVANTPTSGVTAAQKDEAMRVLLVDHGITDNPFPLTAEELGDVTALLTDVNSVLEGLFPGVRKIDVSEVGALTGPIPGVMIFDQTQGAVTKGRKLQNGTDPNSWKDGKVLTSVPCGTGTLKIYGVVTAGKAALHAHFEKT